LEEKMSPNRVGRAGWTFWKVARTIIVFFALVEVIAGSTAGKIAGAVLLVAIFLSYVASGARQPRKRCPQCAENVLAAAQVCKHCGYRFDAQTTGSPDTP
jgi:hypothetical protein